MSRPPLQLIYKKTSVTKLTAFQTHKNILVCLYKLKEFFPARISSVQGVRNSTGKHLLCFAFFIKRFGQPVDMVSDPLGILPCSIMYPQCLPYFDAFLHSGRYHQLTQCTHHCASVSFHCRHKQWYKVSLEGTGNQPILSLVLDSEVF